MFASWLGAVKVDGYAESTRLQMTGNAPEGIRPGCWWQVPQSPFEQSKRPAQPLRVDNVPIGSKAVLRLHATKNNQHKGVKWAQDYEI